MVNLTLTNVLLALLRRTIIHDMERHIAYNHVQLHVYNT